MFCWQKALSANTIMEVTAPNCNYNLCKQELNLQAGVLEHTQA